MKKNLYRPTFESGVDLERRLFNYVTAGLAVVLIFTVIAKEPEGNLSKLLKG